MRTLVVLCWFGFIIGTPRVAATKPFVAPAPALSTYVASHGFKPASNPNANLSALSPMAHSQLEVFLLEGAEAGAQTGDPVLLAWFAAADASLAPWRLTNCGDYNYDIDYDCNVVPWGGNIWQVGLGVQVSDHYGDVAKAFAWAHPNRTTKDVGDEVFRLAAQSKAFPSSVTVAALAASPGGTTQGMHNSYWLSALERDLRVSAYLESSDTNSWPCYRAGYPAWCAWYRQPNKWQEYSDVLSMVIRSWNQIQDQWQSAKVPDVIVDDAAAGFSSSAPLLADGKGGWRGRYAWVAASSSATVLGTWSAKLPVAGKWTVSAFVPYGNHATVSAGKLVVQALDGQHAVNVDQSQIGGSFQKLGSFAFGTSAKVTLSTLGAPGEYVGFDALRFHLVEATTEPPTDGGTDGGSGGTGGKASSSGGTGGKTGSGGAGGAGAVGADGGSDADPSDPELGGAAGGGAGEAGTAGGSGDASAPDAGGNPGRVGGKAGETIPADDGAGCTVSHSTTSADLVWLFSGLLCLRRRRGVKPNR